MENGVRILTNEDLFVHSTTKGETLGARGATRDGRQFVYVLSDASAGLAVGKLGVRAAVVANHVNRSLDSTSAVAVGSLQVVVSVGATAVTQDQYADGYLVVRDGTGKGQMLQIAGNTAVSSAGGAVTVQLQDAVIVALATADTKVDLISPWSGVLASTTLSQAVGVPLATLAAGEYGWVQTKGPASVLADGVITKGYAVGQSTSVAGAVAINGASAATSQTVGVAPEATVDTKYNQLELDVK
jgi:hypothetical protein